ncbi:hypothetical protein V3C10_10675 [[Clostridium] symbiosum]|uniref:hypothetical protein n=1 Tax=Clostridium symbiosum TaxID=1512 RepID=UPI001D06B2AF|nr:hypothetical protein [[Clostridium] symbiosum]MCB6607781.1 hypothetical protein [[Clostridium] symbiosum]MCB6932642.1 hypothetical protein [[Clostridium] symbiosum]
MGKRAGAGTFEKYCHRQKNTIGFITNQQFRKGDFVSDTLEELHKAGFRLAMDDFVQGITEERFNVIFNIAATASAVSGYGRPYPGAPVFFYCR